MDILFFILAPITIFMIVDNLFFKEKERKLKPEELKAYKTLVQSLINLLQMHKLQYTGVDIHSPGIPDRTDFNICYKDTTVILKEWMGKVTLWQFKTDDGSPIIDEYVLDYKDENLYHSILHDYRS